MISNINELKDYDIVGECPIKSQGKWNVPVVSAQWIEKKYLEYCDVDPRGNVSGYDEGGRFCLSL